MAVEIKRKMLNISLPLELYSEVEELARRESKTKGEFAREILRHYVEEDKRWRRIRKWGEETAQKFGIRDEEDVERIIDECEEEQEKGLPAK